jgi:hypothetical protein
MAADRQRQQNRAADLPFFFLAMKAERKRDRADRRAQHDRCDNEHGIPQDDALDFKGCHAGVVHRCDTAANDRAAEPWPVAPVRSKRYGEPHAGQEDGRDQRKDG